MWAVCKFSVYNVGLTLESYSGDCCLRCFSFVSGYYLQFEKSTLSQSRPRLWAGSIINRNLRIFPRPMVVWPRLFACLWQSTENSNILNVWNYKRDLLLTKSSDQICSSGLTWHAAHNLVKWNFGRFSQTSRTLEGALRKYIV